eukprot:2827426-Pyramimonas_sp.AAC.1
MAISVFGSHDHPGAEERGQGTGTSTTTGKMLGATASAEGKIMGEGTGARMGCGDTRQQLSTGSTATCHHGRVDGCDGDQQQQPLGRHREVRWQPQARWGYCSSIGVRILGKSTTHVNAAAFGGA